MPDTSPPVGSVPATLPCAPCGQPPTDCLADVQTLYRQYCDLKTNYLGVLQKLATLRASLASQHLEINDLIGDVAGLQKQIDDLGGGDCSRIGQSSAPDALIVCEGGVEKAFAAPTNDGFSLISKGGKWQTASPGGYWHPAPDDTFLFVDHAAGNVAITFPGYPAGSTSPVWAVFLSNIFVTNGSGSGQMLLNGGQTLNFERAFGSNADGLYAYSMARVNPTETFNLISVGGAVLSCDLQLLGYFANN